jgi:MFS family permease
MTNAIALNATMFNSATAVGPAVAGVIYALLGPAWCFTINGISFIAVIVALASMRLQPQVTPQHRHSTFAALKEGISYIKHQPTVRTLIGLVATASIFGMSLATLIPAWSVKILHGNAATNGILFSARGVGSLIGALSIASMGRAFSRGKFITAGSLLFPIFIAIFALIHWLPFSLLLMAFIGFSTIFVMNLCNASIQSLVPDYLRGRVMGVYSTIFIGSMPLGALFLGTIAEHAGEAEAAWISSAIALTITLSIMFFVPKVRTIK